MRARSRRISPLGVAGPPARAATGAANETRTLRTPVPVSAADAVRPPPRSCYALCARALCICIHILLPKPTGRHRRALDTNLLAGTLPASLGTLTNLTTLKLPNNYIYGTVPASLGNLTSLRTLNLFECAPPRGARRAPARAVRHTRRRARVSSRAACHRRRRSTPGLASSGVPHTTHQVYLTMRPRAFAATC